jgi:cysteine synthase A
MTTAIIMPDDVAEEKVKAIKALGANVERVRPASIVDKKQVRTSKNHSMSYKAHAIAVRCKS